MTHSEEVQHVASLSDADLVVAFQRRLRLYFDTPRRTLERDILGGEVDLMAKIMRDTGRMSLAQITEIINQTKGEKR